MGENIILNFKKLDDIEITNLKEFIEFKTSIRIISNKTVVHEEFNNILYYSSILDNKKDLISELSKLGHDINIIVKSLSKLNINSDIVIEIHDINLDPCIYPNYLD